MDPVVNNPACEVIRRTMAEASVGELQGRLADDVEEHLSVCTDCSNYRNELLALHSHLSGFTIPAPGELYPYVVQALPAYKSMMTRRLAILLLILMAAVCTLALQWYLRHEEEAAPSNCEASKTTAMSETFATPIQVNTEAYSPTSQLEQAQSQPSPPSRYRN